jgi:outer membrane protein
MKKLIKISLTVFCLTLLISNTTIAQTKIAYININQLIELLPETNAAKTTLTTFQKQLSDQLTTMYTELQTKGQAYEKSKATMPDAIKTTTETDLADLQKRIQDFEEKAKTQFADKQNALLAPIVDKARKTALQVSDEKGYAFLFDTSSGNLLKGPASDNLLDVVKLKLGIK